LSAWNFFDRASALSSIRPRAKVVSCARGVLLWTRFPNQAHARERAPLRGVLYPTLSPPVQRTLAIADR